MGSTLLGAALLGIDTVPMRGPDLTAVDKEFDLRSQVYSALAVIPFGYCNHDDFDTEIPKSRLSQSTIFTKA